MLATRPADSRDSRACGPATASWGLCTQIGPRPTFRQPHRPADTV